MPRRVMYAAAVVGGIWLSSWILAFIFLAIAWVISAWFWPFAPCRRCQGRKSNKGSTRRRYGPCGKCGGTGSRQVIGSQQVHRAVLATIRYRKNRKRST